MYILLYILYNLAKKVLNNFEKQLKLPGILYSLAIGDLFYVVGAN